MKRFFSALIVFCMLCALLPLSASAATSGNCGDGVKWRYTASTSTLKITYSGTGTGAMDDYSRSDPPWYEEDYSESIEIVTIANGVTYIGHCAFQGCDSLESITIPVSVTGIGSGAFEDCTSLTTVNYSGTAAQFRAISIGTYNSRLFDAYYGDGEHNWVTPDPSDTQHYCAATCDEDGWYVEYCSYCGEEGEEYTLDAPGHNWVTGTPVPPTCEDYGYTPVTCSVCGETDEINLVDELGHNWTVPDPSDAQHYCAAACGVDGWYYEICSVCGEIGDEITIPMPQDHNWVPADPSDTQHYCAPTCEGDGWYDEICSICGEIGDFYYIDALEHNWVTGTPVPPTCEDYGYTPVTCSICGETDEIDIIDELGHTWTIPDPSDTQHYCAACCGEDGWYYEICSVCGAIGDEIEIPMPQDHNWVPAAPSDTQHYCAPTCENNGWYDEICSICGEVGDSYVIDALEHNWVAGTPVPPNCEDYGYTPVTCTNCGETDEIDIIDELGHDWTIPDPSDTQHYCAASCGEDGWYDEICSVCGAIGDEIEIPMPQDHNWVPADHSDTQHYCAPTCEEDGWYDVICSICGEIGDRYWIVALGHEWVAGTPVPPNCEDYGYTPVTCTNCGETDEIDIIDELGHDWTIPDPSNTQHYYAANCTEAGWYDEICSVCGKIGEECVIDPLGHNWVLDSVEEPNCTEYGYSLYICASCGEEEERSIVPATGHNWAPADSSDTQHYHAANCLEDGWYDEICAACGQIGESHIIDALGHNYIDHTAQEPTCTQIGWAAYQTCSRCDYSTYAEQPALGHNMIEIDRDDATCTQNGAIFYRCSRCGRYDTQNIAAYGHDWSEWQCTTAPDCTTAGEETRTCSRCNETESNVLTALGHNYLAVVTAPTCTEDGFTTYTCSRCSDSYVADPEPALGHHYELTILRDATTSRDGKLGVNCTRCDFNALLALPSLSADDYDLTNDTATCTEAGTATFTWKNTTYGVYSTVGPTTAQGHALTFTDNGNGTHTATCSRCDYSLTEAHSYTECVCVCGDVAAKIAAAYPVLDEDIDLVFAANLPAGAQSPYVVFTYQNSSYTVEEYSVNDSGQYCFTFTHINPQCMGDAITAVLHASLDGKNYTDTVNAYSVRQYCINMLAETENTTLKTLLSDLLTYGAAAQTYTGYHTDSLVTDGLDLTPSAFSAISERTASFTGTADPVCDWVSAGLVLGNNVAMRFIFTVESLDNLTVAVSVNGREEVYDAEDFTDAGNGMYYFDFWGIEAVEFDDAVTAAFYRGNTPVGRTLEYSVNAYVCGTQNSDNSALQALVRALYNYGVSAAAFSP